MGLQPGACVHSCLQEGRRGKCSVAGRDIWGHCWWGRLSESFSYRNCRSEPNDKPWRSSECCGRSVLQLNFPERITAELGRLQLPVSIELCQRSEVAPCGHSSSCDTTTREDVLILSLSANTFATLRSPFGLAMPPDGASLGLSSALKRTETIDCGESHRRPYARSLSGASVSVENSPAVRGTRSDVGAE